ncbi:Fic family protein [Aeromicrobium sp. 179-A 4D2 NHS]|uniref:Fic family protein n=1 Tax=Aeromicrobium sp. 179-A 4D2 NHS TaxID=3142375 RepID=UPI0039A2E230
MKTEKYSWEHPYKGRESISTAVMPPIAGATPNVSLAAFTALDSATSSASRFDEYAHAKLGADALGLMATVEAIGSSRIENIHATVEELLVARATRKFTDATLLVHQNRTLTEMAFWTRDDITFETFRTFHSALMDGVDPRAGFVRESVSWIGGGWSGPRAAVFVPPKPERVPDALEDLVAFTGRYDIPPLLHVALAHAQYEAIHPFSDGNGRTGRALVHAMLASAGVSQRTVLPISPFIDTMKRSYYDALMAFRDGEVEPIVQVFSTAVSRASQWGCQVVDELAAVHDRMRSVNMSRADSAATRLIDALFTIPATTVLTASTVLGVPATSSRAAIETLEGLGLLTEVTGKKRGRVWVARDISDALTLGLRTDGFSR